MLLRERSVTAPSAIQDRARTPSHLISKSQLGSEKGCSAEPLLWGVPRVVSRDTRAAVPTQAASGAVVAPGIFPLEAAILERMILRLHREALVRMALRRPFGHRPGFQRTLNRQPEVVVQARRGMFLHHERISVLRGGADFEPQLWHRLRQARACSLRLACRSGPVFLWFFRFTRRLRRAVKLALPPVFFQLRHGSILPHAIPPVALAARALVPTRSFPRMESEIVRIGVPTPGNS